jgi:hypothetical protein
VFRAKLDGSTRSEFVPSAFVNTPSCLAIDWISRCLYWGSETASTIEVIQLDGAEHYRRVLLAASSGGVVANPMALAVDAVNGLDFKC